MQQIKITMKPKFHDTSNSELMKQYPKTNFKVMSKKIVLALFLLSNLSVLAQKPCEIDSDIKDTIGTYKSTKQYMIFERSFAGNSTNVFFSLTNTNGVLGIEAQILQRSNEFIKANCLNNNSKIYLQLQNGKIVTLINIGGDSCGTLIRDDKNYNNRVLTANFVFSKENYEDLKTSPVTFMRIQYAGETKDYPFRTAFVSELDKALYEPGDYFMNYIKCIEAN